MFRNLRFYRVTSPWPENEEALSECLSENVFSPCGSFSERSAGWEAFGSNENDPLCRRLNGADLIQLRTQSRVLPVAAVKEALEERLMEFRSRMELEPTPGELRRLREETRDKLLPKALVKSERNRACYLHSESLLVIDVDHFKRFNDTYGHDVGDKVLQRVAEVLRQQARRPNVACRYGGEEFAVILPRTGAADAMVLAERLRECVASETGDPGVTVSIGVAGLADGEFASSRELFKAADLALYHAKDSGRDLVKDYRPCLDSTDDIHAAPITG